MSAGEHYVGGELYLSLETVAEIYQVKIVVLQEAFELGLLGAGADSDAGPGARLCIAAVQLDRVATIVRLHSVLGLNLAAIALTLDSPE